MLPRLFMEHPIPRVVDSVSTQGDPMTFPEKEGLPPVSADQAEIDAKFEQLDRETRRAADFVANLAGVIRDIRNKN
jgi:hypothetical protein